jgi:hypothetical protein
LLGEGQCEGGIETVQVTGKGEEPRERPGPQSGAATRGLLHPGPEPHALHGIALHAEQRQIAPQIRQCAVCVRIQPLQHIASRAILEILVEFDQARSNTYSYRGWNRQRTGDASRFLKASHPLHQIRGG